MKRLIQFVARLYPKSWRERYGSEFAALLEEVNPDWRTSVDILRGALEMQITIWSFNKILLAAGLAGALAAFAASFWIAKPNAEMFLTVTGPADRTAAREAVLSLAKKTFFHPTLTRVDSMPLQTQWKGKSAFHLAFTFKDPNKDPNDRWKAMGAFVRENQRRSPQEQLKIVSAGSGPAILPYPNRLLIALIGLSASGWVALALTLASNRRASQRTA